MARRSGKKSLLQTKKTADIKKGSVFFPSMQDVKVANKADVARESAMPSLDVLSALKNRTLTHYSEFLNADVLTVRAKRVAKRQKIAVCITISIVFLILALLVVYFLGLISLSKDSHSHNATKRYYLTMTMTEERSTDSLTRVITRKIKHKSRIIPSDLGNDISILMTTRVTADFVSTTENSTAVAINKSITAEGDNITVKRKDRVGQNYSIMTATNVTTTNSNDFGTNTFLLKLDAMI
uniref:Uncharacterized protein n=1 Tax=Romanomermis culicivorax TaxID=13658 RepID=A0A915J2J8_ROMCU